MPQGQWIPLVIVIVIGYVGWFVAVLALYNCRRKRDKQKANLRPFQKTK